MPTYEKFDHHSAECRDDIVGYYAAFRDKCPVGRTDAHENGFVYLTRYADVFQFTGLTHGEGGRPSAGGFAIAEVEQRRDWLLAAAADRADAIELSVLVQTTDVADDADARVDQLASRFGLDREQLLETPFVLAGSVERVVDQIERLRERLGVSHFVVRELETFAPVVEALRAR